MKKEKIFFDKTVEKLKLLLLFHSLLAATYYFIIKEKIILDMIRTEIERSNLSDTDCREKWPKKQNQPYYIIEERFTKGQGTGDFFMEFG